MKVENEDAEENLSYKFGETCLLSLFLLLATIIIFFLSS